MAQGYAVQQVYLVEVGTGNVLTEQARGGVTRKEAKVLAIDAAQRGGKLTRAEAASLKNYVRYGMEDDEISPRQWTFVVRTIRGV